MTKARRWITALRCACLPICVAAATAQVPPGEALSITDPRPLAQAAEILGARYGVPVSYEDVSAYAYAGDLSAAQGNGAVRTDAALLPRPTSLKFFAEPLSVSYNPVRPADAASVARLLQGLLAQHETAGNPGRFKLLDTAAGLVIVPSAVRDGSGAFVADHSLLDLRISFPTMQGNAELALWAFRDALKAASGKDVSIEGISAQTGPISANNEVARDVLVRLLNGLDRFVGTSSTPEGPPPPKLVWNLTTESETPYTAHYHIAFRKVIMEYRDAHGRRMGPVQINR